MNGGVFVTVIVMVVMIAAIAFVWYANTNTTVSAQLAMSQAQGNAFLQALQGPKKPVEQKSSGLPTQ